MKTNGIVSLLAVAGTTTALFNPFGKGHGRHGVEPKKIHAREAAYEWSDIYRRDPAGNGEAPKSSSGGKTGGSGAAAPAKPAGGSGAAAAKPASGGGASQGAAAKPVAGAGASPAAKPAGAAPKPAASPAAQHPTAAAPAAAHPAATHPAAASPAATHPATGGGASAKPAVNGNQGAHSVAAPPKPSASNGNRAGGGGGATPKQPASSPAAAKPANPPTTSDGANKAQNPGFPTGSFPHPTGAPTFAPRPSAAPHPAPVPVPSPTQPKPSTPAGGACPAVWTQISSDLKTLFTTGAPGPGQCNDMARAVVRMAFHDCGAWQLSQGTNGGCDGSLYLAGEFTQPQNAGLEQSVPQYASLASKYGVSVADFIQFGAAHATVTCPLGPTVQTFVGRLDRSTPNDVSLLPSGNDSAATIIANFAAKGLSSDELVALIGAHTSAKQFEFDPADSGAPLDDTPGVWDVRFYSEVVENNAPFVLPSDKNIAQSPVTSGAFKSFVKNQNGWNAAFSKAMTHLSLLGVPQTGLIDCTSALPPPQDNFQEPGGLINIKKRSAGFGFHGGFHGFGGHGHGAQKRSYHA